MSVTVRDVLAARQSDIAVFFCAVPLLLLFCILKRLPLWNHLTLVSVDAILPRPRTLLERLRARVVRGLLGAVDLFIFFFRDTRELEHWYAVGAERIAYIPFKINDYMTVLATPTSDEGFILSCGRSHRDYGTLCRALAGLPYEARILATPGELAKHGRAFDVRSLPANVKWVTDDGSSRSWIDWIARCRFVVLPILPAALAPAGISTYLVAMALGKCVVITEGPATRGVLDDGQAVVVPPSDAKALRAAIIKVSEEREYREGVAARGRAYALSLRDEGRLASDVCHEVVKRVAALPSPNGRLRRDPPK